jgi:Flp pilus assembly protein CpaB
MRVKKTSKRLLLMLCIIVCVCLFLTRSVNEIQSEGTSAQLATQIPHGMRAVTVPVSSKTTPDKALLYPGCFVDVMVTYRLNKSRIPEAIPDFIVDLLIKCKLIRNNRGAFSTTMLRGIQVLTIKRDLSGTHVTVLVNPKQAEALSLAAQHSSISLSVRNPSDKKNDLP